MSMKNVIEKLVQICEFSQKDLKEFLIKELRSQGRSIFSGDGYLFSPGTVQVLLVAHMDTVHRVVPQQIETDEEGRFLSSPQGIGGDDRCGIYAILEIIKEQDVSVLFCEDEEKGGIGAEKFIKTELAAKLSFNYLIELDREGFNDAVFYRCANDDFQKFILEDFWELKYGSFTDISVLAPYFQCAAVNLSCGYYNSHTTKEYIVVIELETVICQVNRLLERKGADREYEYVEEGPELFAEDVFNWYKYDFHIKFTKNGKVLQENVEASTELEALQIFLGSNKDIGINDIVDVDIFGK